MDELRRRLAVILAVEEREPTDWLEVERLASELQRELPIDATPEAVHRYLDDADIRCRRLLKLQGTNFGLKWIHCEGPLSAAVPKLG